MVLALFGLALAGACDGPGVVAGVYLRSTPQDLIVDPPTLDLLVGDVRALASELRTRDRQVLNPLDLGLRLGWTSSNTGVISVDASGKVTAVAKETATVTARYQGVEGSALVRVTARPAAIVLKGSSLHGWAGSPVPGGVRIQIEDQNGNPLADVTARFTMVGAGGSVQPQRVKTGADGVATVVWTLGPSAGRQALEVAAVRGGLTPSGLAAIGAAAPPEEEVLTSVMVYADAESPPLDPPVITTTSLPSATVGTAYTQTLAATGGNGSYTWAVTAGALPAGLSLNVSSGAITGTPTTAATSNFTVQATSAGLTDTKALSITVATSGSSLANECNAPSSSWIWCDNFDVNRLSSYSEHNGAGSFPRQTGVGVDGSTGMAGTFTAGNLSLSNLILNIGANADQGYLRPVDGGVLNYRDVYWRIFVRTQAGCTGGGGKKLTRSVVIIDKNWSTAAMGHVWNPSSTARNLQADPARGTDAAGNVLTSGWNDFGNFTWLGSAQGSTDLFSPNVWYCIEVHMQLNDLGLSNGVLEVWADGGLQARKASLNFQGAYEAYGINQIMLENYWDSPGGPANQARYMDNFVVSTEPIGCTGGTPGGSKPVAVVQISGGTSVAQGSTLGLTATLKDRTNATVAGGVTWATSNGAVATVNGSGQVVGVSPGTATITATAGNGKRGSRIVTVTAGSGAPSVTTASLPGGTVGTAYTQTLAATGGNGTYTWAVTTGSLPAGLSLNASSGAITGTPTTAATSNFTVQATSAGQNGTKALSITVAAGSTPPNITTASLPGGTVGTAYSQTLAATGGNDTYAWAVTAGSLPAGLSLNVGTGTITGTSTTAGASNFTVQVTSNAMTATRALSITIFAAGVSNEPAGYTQKADRGFEMVSDGPGG